MIGSLGGQNKPALSCALPATILFRVTEPGQGGNRQVARLLGRQIGAEFFVNSRK